MANDTKTINYVSLSNEAFQWAINYCNKLGMRPNEFIGYLVERAFIDNQSNQELKSSNPDVRIFDRQNKSKVRKLRMLHIKQQAMDYIESGKKDEYLAELLMESCDDAGVNYLDIINELATDPFSMIAVSAAEKGSKFMECVTWLSKLLQEHNPIRSSDVYKMGEEFEYSDTMIKRARDYINDHMVAGQQILSIRTPGERSWSFTLMDRNKTKIESNKITDPDETTKPDQFSTFLIAGSEM